MHYQIFVGDNRETLKTIADNSVDAIVTDPPYGIDFLGRDWDANTGALETYQQCFRVLKPGGYILAFSAARTYHHLAMRIEQAGFEIRDQIMWIYSQGMPKGNNLKPAHEPIVMACKHKAAPLNIDACRIPREPMRYPTSGHSRMTFAQSKPGKWAGEYVENHSGGYPHNVLGEIEHYQKYYYCPKVSKAERGVNNHPTVKPIELMKYLIRLVTPPGGTVLDPFTGSGSTGCAAVALGHPFIGCELDPRYVNIARTRIEAWSAQCNPTTFNNLFT